MDERLYKNIILYDIVLACGAAVLIYLISLRYDYALSVLYGMVLNVLGFFHNIYTSESILYSKKAKLLGGGHFVIRYIFYGVACYIATRYGANLICILVGFTCLSIAIKIVMMKSKGE